MPTIEKAIDVHVPVSTAYNQWTQFEEFPRFMEGVEAVAQVRDDLLRWRANVLGRVLEWDAEIDEQEPDVRIAWHSTTGAKNRGSVSFHRLSDLATRLILRLEYETEGFAESVGDAFGVVSRRVEGDLLRFKDFLEKRGHETGAWRGEIHDGRVHAA